MAADTAPAATICGAVTCVGVLLMLGVNIALITTHKDMFPPERAQTEEAKKWAESTGMTARLVIWPLLSGAAASLAIVGALGHTKIMAMSGMAAQGCAAFGTILFGIILQATGPIAEFSDMREETNKENVVMLVSSQCSLYKSFSPDVYKSSHCDIFEKCQESKGSDCLWRMSAGDALFDQYLFCLYAVAVVAALVCLCQCASAATNFLVASSLENEVREQPLGQAVAVTGNQPQRQVQMTTSPNPGGQPLVRQA